MLARERYRPPDWPDGLPQQLPLDTAVEDLAPPPSTRVELGAPGRGSVHEEGETFIVYLDPAGDHTHTHCLCQDR